LSRDGCDEVIVRVVVQEGEMLALGDGRDQEIWNFNRSV